MMEFTSGRSVRLLLTVLFCIVSIAAVAQSAGFGAVSGTVQDASGAVVASAKVTLDNPSKGIHREMESTGSGNFDFQNITPASGYTIKIEKAGFSITEYKDVTVQVGETVTLMPKLAVAGSGTQVEVTSQAPLVDFTKTDTSTVVNSDQILQLPINGRRVDNFVMLTPGVSNDGAFGLISFRGSPGGNNFQTDGVDTTNAYYGENAGRTRTYNISQDAVQEFQVVSSNYAAEFGKAAGGVINTVTRSGSNNWHGSAYEFYRTATLAATDRSTVNGITPKGWNPPEWRHQAGVSVGGPIVRNKLFFFFNGEVFRRNAPAVSSNLNGGSGNNLFNGDGSFKAPFAQGTSTNPGGSCVVSASGPTQAQCDAAHAYLYSRAATQLIPRTMENNMLFGKIDWHPTDKDSISFSSNYLDFRSPNGIQTQLSLATGAAIGNNGDTSVFDRTFRTSWTRVITNSMLNEFRFGSFKDRQFDPASMQTLPSFNGTPGYLALTVNSVSNLGWAQNYPRTNPDEWRLEFADNFSWTAGRHNMKFGASIGRTEDYVISMPSQFPFYQYSSVTAFAQDFNGTTAVGSQHYSTYSQTVGNAKVDFHVVEAAAYAQDEWHLSSKFTLTPGIRIDHSTVPQPVAGTCNPLFTQTCTLPSNGTHVAPRLGFAYGYNNKTAIHGGYGLFNNRYITSTIENLLVGNGLYQKGYSFSGSTLTATQKACLPTFPNILPQNWTPTGACALSLQPNVIFADQNYRPSYSQQADLGIDREITKNTGVSVSYVWSRTLRLPVTQDLNVSAPTQSVGYQVLDASNAVVGTYTTPVYTAFNPAYIFGGTQYKGRVGELQSAANSYYNAMLLTVRHKQGKWFNGSLSYTYGHTIDWGVGAAPTFGSTTPSSYVNGYYAGERGSSTLDRRHNLVVNMVFAPTLMKGDNLFAKYVANGWQLAIVNIAASSQPIAPTFVSSGSFSPCTGTTTLSASGSQVCASGLAARSGSLNGLGSTTRIPFESLSALNIGPLNRMDARVSKNFPVTERVNVALGFEAFNVLNHLIVSGRDSGQYNVSVIKNAAGFYTLSPRNTYSAITATQVTPDGTTARRAQGVIRITF